jgi:hypothetical protein
MRLFGGGGVHFVLTAIHGCLLLFLFKLCPLRAPLCSWVHLHVPTSPLLLLFLLLPAFPCAWPRMLSLVCIVACVCVCSLSSSPSCCRRFCRSHNAISLTVKWLETLVPSLCVCARGCAPVLTTTQRWAEAGWWEVGGGGGGRWWSHGTCILCPCPTLLVPPACVAPSPLPPFVIVALPHSLVVPSHRRRAYCSFAIVA